MAEGTDRFKQRRRPHLSVILAAYMTALVLLTSAILTGLFYRFSINHLMQQIDDHLLAATHFTKAALPADFHDRIEDADSLAEEEYDQIVDRHNRLCAQLNLQYLWSCMLLDNGIVFTSATSPSHNIENKDHARFYEKHRDPHSFGSVFKSMKPTYSSFDNEWGHGRMVLVPFRDIHGRAYCFGASMSVNDVMVAQRELLDHTLVLCLGVVLFAMLGTLFLARKIARPIRNLTASATLIRDGNLTAPVIPGGPSELRQLAGALDAMRLSIGESLMALKENEEQQRQLLDNISAAVVIHDSDTQIVYSNPRAGVLLGLTAEQMRGKAAIDPEWRFIHEDGRGMELDEYPVNRVLNSLEPLSDYVVGVKRPDRPDNTWVLANAFPELTEEGTVRQVVVTFVDITALKHLEKQLLQAQKMEAIGQLAGGIAHDFNNILQAVTGFTQLALHDIDPDHSARESLEEVINASDRAARMVNQLLAFSRRQLMEPSFITVNEVIEGMVDMLQRVIGEHIELEFIPGHQLGTVEADPTMFEQVLLNLCVNSRDAMSEGGQLTIETENVFFDSKYCEHNPWAQPGRYVLTCVTDTGSGIDPELLDRIFEPFFTTKDTGRGTGLGLATVYGAIRQHDGMVRVYSEQGKGTAFKIYLPAVERPADAVGTKIEGKPQRGNETILVAEDDDSLRDLAQRMLERAGYTVLTAENGKKAIEVFNNHSEDVDLLLLDVVMPEIGGRGVFDTIHKQRPDIPALFASGYSQNAIHTNFVLQAGMKLIRKPYDANELLRRVREILDS